MLPNKIVASRNKRGEVVRRKMHHFRQGWSNGIVRE